jgi:transketolase
MEPVSELDRLCVNTLRFLSADMVQHANSGHPGLPMGAAPMAYVLWTRFLKHAPAHPTWQDRDRFILSAGHGSALLYSLLHLCGYDLGLEDLKRFRQWDSRTPGHPEPKVTAGVDVNTGPLGQGFGNAVGMAIAEAHLAARYNQPGHRLIHHFTYVLASDGDLMEGISYEAASLAGHLGLGRLICLYDDNRVTLSESTDASFSEDHAKRFEACGWHVQRLPNGEDLDAIDRAIAAAQRETERPSILLVRTHLGFGSPHKQDRFEAHGSPLGAEELRLSKRALGWPETPDFHIPPAAAAQFRAALDNGRAEEDAWRARLQHYTSAFPAQSRELADWWKGQRPEGWDKDLPVFEANPKGLATRAAASQVLQVLAPRLPGLVGGSGDLNPSTLTALKGLGDFQPPRPGGDRQGSSGGGWDYSGRNLHFGVREHAMGAALNGMAAHGGLLPFGATFLVFSDYLRPTLRLAAMTQLHVIYVFTHDSIGLGEDGPSHQPVEHLASLRAIPGLTVIRPGDANECTEAWRVAAGPSGGPMALILSRQAVPTLDRRSLAPAAGLRQGAYVLSRESAGAEALVLIASGSELGLVVEAAARLQSQGHAVRVVSMPSWELFEAQDASYRESVLPGHLPLRLAVEAGVAQGWERYVGDLGGVLSVERYGASAPGAEVMKQYGFTVEEVCRRALELPARRKAGSAGR